MAKRQDPRDRAAKLLADVESELRHVDAADEQLGAHGADAESRIAGDLDEPADALDPDSDAKRTFRLGQLRRARQVVDAARAARDRRGA